ncbi:hypothetical protein Ancab_033683 [Ancistrocladus abbreviatus]
MPAADPNPITTTGPLLLRHIRRHLNHLHQPRNYSEITPQDPHLLHWHYARFDDRNFEIHGQTLFYIFILFSIILLVTLLLLYARWFFRFRHLAASTAAAATAATMSVSEQQLIIPSPRPNQPPRPNGLEPNIIQSLPIMLHQSSATDCINELECCICLGVFEDGDKVKVLPKCQHRYHCDCVDRWLISHSNCPLCRISIWVDPVVDSGLV